MGLQYINMENEDYETPKCSQHPHPPNPTQPCVQLFDADTTTSQVRFCCYS